MKFTLGSMNCRRMRKKWFQKQVFYLRLAYVKREKIWINVIIISPYSCKSSTYSKQPLFQASQNLKYENVSSEINSGVISFFIYFIIHWKVIFCVLLLDLYCVVFAFWQLKPNTLVFHRKWKCENITCCSWHWLVNIFNNGCLKWTFLSNLSSLTILSLLF